MNAPKLTESERMAVDALKSDAHIFINCPRAHNQSRLAAIAVSELAMEMGGIWVRHATTGEQFWVPPGTPWQEALIAP